MLRREIFAGVTSAAPPARTVIRLTYAGEQLCHGLDVASRTWPIFFGWSSTGPGLPGSFVDDCLTEPVQQDLQISANPGQARHFGSWYWLSGTPPHQDLGPPVPAAALFAGHTLGRLASAQGAPTVAKPEPSSKGLDKVAAQRWPVRSNPAKYVGEGDR